MSEGAYRLPRDVVPKAYEIEISTTPRKRTFDGWVRITVRVHKPTDQVELHARHLKISDAEAVLGRKKLPARVKRMADRQTVILRFDAELPRGEAILRMHFAGKLDERMNGLYLAQSGNERVIASQCEAAEARGIFPCWDEPDLKATLQWTVRTDEGLTVVTNGALEGTTRERKTGQVIHRFAPTAVLPTYLSAITVGRFEATRPVRVAGTPCRVLAPEGKIGQAAFAEEATAFSLPWFTGYFGQKYRYKKLDQVAIPGFDAGAMENAGAIFYRQQLLLMDPATTSWTGKKAIAETIAHEIAHQWFGNRVTMVWWDDLWLNEAFATWISHKAVDEWKPDWRIWDDFQSLRRHAMGLDALETTHPIWTPVQSPAEATEMFDAITYYKGCCVMRQLETWMGADVFRDALRVYVDRFKDRNAKGEDLWRALAEASGAPVQRVAESWISQPGFPLVSVEASERDGSTVLRLSQRRFFASSAAMGRESEQRWSIPMGIRYGTPGGGTEIHRLLLEEESAEVELPVRAAWFHANADAVGFYRTRLDDASLRSLLGEGLGSLTAAERQALLDDLWANVVSGLSPIDRFLDALAAFRQERDYVVLESIVARLSFLVNRLGDDETLPRLRAFVSDLLGPALDELGWEPAADEGPERSMARTEVVGALGDLGRVPEVLDRAEQLAARERAEPGSIDPNLAGVVVALGALRGGPRQLEAYVAEYEKRRDRQASPEEQVRYIRALASFEKQVQPVLELARSGVVPQEQLGTVLRGLLARPATAEKTWRFLQIHWAEIGGRVGLMGISRVVEGLGSLPAGRRRSIERFFRENPVDEAKRALAQALEAMALREELHRREGARLASWLAAGQAGAAPAGGTLRARRRASTR